MSKNKKIAQLGMDVGTASSQLKKSILFSAIKKLNQDTCYRCQKKIDTVNELSIDHIVPWIDSPSPKELFFDLDNVTFSHLSCNIGCRRSVGQKYFSDVERLEAKRKRTREYMRRTYTTDRRKQKFKSTGW